jgi:hypothetical protein
MERNGFTVISPNGILGYGFPEESFRRGMERDPDVVGVDAGSTDPGPAYLGSGKSFTTRMGVKRDLEIIMSAVVPRGVPLIIGSAGGSGGAPHLDWTREILLEVASERRLSFRLGTVTAEIPKPAVLESLRAGRITPMDCVPPLAPEDVERSTRIVAQMGAEPVQSALDQGCQVILCGRCYDPVPFAAPAIRAGFDSGLAYHMGKILECGAIAATPGSGKDCVLATVHEHDFVLESLNPERRFTELSTAAHSLYEKSNPWVLPGPGGAIHLDGVRFREEPGGRVRVSGSRWEPTRPYRIKLEGARQAGFRTVSIAGIRDPRLIAALDAAMASAREQAERHFGPDLRGARLLFHAYGRDAVMGSRDPGGPAPAEIGLVLECVAPSQELASAVCAFARSTLLHLSYPGRIATAGNLALLYSPSELECGPVYEFSVYHLMEVADPEEFFPLQVSEVRQ